MSIYGAAIALNLAFNSSTAIVLDTTTHTNKASKPNQVAQNILALPNLLWQNTTELGIYRRKNTT
jgi:hypothetical protein